MENQDSQQLQNENGVLETDTPTVNEPNDQRIEQEADINSHPSAFASTSSAPADLEVVEFLCYVPKSNSLTSSYSIDQMKFEDLYMEDLGDLDENLEREAVRLKYETVFRPVHSCSCIQDLHHNRSSTSTQSSDSWSDFAKWLEAFEQPEYYNEACEFCKLSTAAPNRSLEIQFIEAEKLLSLRYPYYWRNLLQKYDTNLRSDIYIKETIRKNMIINSCKRLLKEEQRYSEETHRLHIGENGRIRFDGKMSNLNADFKTACIFMREEYPMLFVHLIKKLELSKFDIEKKVVEGNKQRIVELASQSDDKLKELDRKYREKEERRKRT